MGKSITFPVTGDMHGSPITNAVCTMDVEVLANHLRPHLGDTASMHDVHDEDLPPTQGTDGKMHKNKRAVGINKDGEEQPLPPAIGEGGQQNDGTFKKVKEGVQQ